MIRYAITKEDLESEIEKKQPGWLKRAAERAEKIKKSKKYDEATEIWGEVKDVYRRLQGQKCAYCERQLAGDPHGSIEHDIEHFRPKNATSKWVHNKVDKTWHQQGRLEGYYWLAYDVFNYATSCKVCNSPLKSNGFPIARSPGKELDTVDKLNRAEKPLLIYPISNKDADPEKLIRFDGIAAITTNTNATTHLHRRAIVTIEFFALNDRDELLRERASVVKSVWEALEKRDRPGSSLDQQQLGKDDLVTYMCDGHPHANCARSFVRTYEADPEGAHHLYVAAREIYDKLVRGGKPTKKQNR